MDDLISRQDAIKEIECLKSDIDSDIWNLAIKSAIIMVKHLVSPAQPQRMKGHWTEDKSCQFCGKQPWYEYDIHTLKFCPYCGADMREETEHD